MCKGKSHSPAWHGLSALSSPSWDVPVLGPSASLLWHPQAFPWQHLSLLPDPEGIHIRLEDSIYRHLDCNYFSLTCRLSNLFCKKLALFCFFCFLASLRRDFRDRVLSWSLGLEATIPFFFLLPFTMVSSSGFSSIKRIKSYFKLIKKYSLEIFEVFKKNHMDLFLFWSESF